MVKYYDWDKEKDAKLKAERNVCFEDVLTAMDEKGLLDVINHPNQAKHPNQKMYVVRIEEYVYLVPFIEDEDKFFLKTIYPSRKMSKKYLTRKE